MIKIELATQNQLDRVKDPGNATLCEGFLVGANGHREARWLLTGIDAQCQWGPLTPESNGSA